MIYASIISFFTAQSIVSRFKSKKNQSRSEEEEEATALSMEVLPEGCVSAILSLSSPSDACRSSLVSSTFRSAAESDLVWERFLPQDYCRIISTMDSPLKFSSKKELYRRLCDSHIIDGGKKIFRLENSSGKISYILSARELSIIWSHDPIYWTWKSIPESRFREVAELRTVSWLEIRGKIRTQTLSPKTRYGAYLLMKFTNRSYGLDLIPSEVSVQVGNEQISKGLAYLREKDEKQQQMESLFYGNRVEAMRNRVVEGERRVCREREDGWMEIELGEFFNGGSGDDEEVEMSLMEVKGYQLKSGVIVEGIEVRPKC